MTWLLAPWEWTPAGKNIHNQSKWWHKRRALSAIANSHLAGKYFSFAGRDLLWPAGLGQRQDLSWRAWDDSSLLVTYALAGSRSFSMTLWAHWSFQALGWWVWMAVLAPLQPKSLALEPTNINLWDIHRCITDTNFVCASNSDGGLEACHSKQLMNTTTIMKHWAL